MQSTPIESLAADLGVTPAMAADFLQGVGIWTAKGYSIEDAIKRNLDVWQQLVYRVCDGLTNEYSPYRTQAKELLQHLAGEVWETVNARKAVQP